MRRCRCKDDARRAARYSDDGEGLEPVQGLERAIRNITDILLKILSLVILICTAPVLLLVVIVNAMIGRKTTLKITAPKAQHTDDGRRK